MNCDTYADDCRKIRMDSASDDGEISLNVWNSDLLTFSLGVSCRFFTRGGFWLIASASEDARSGLTLEKMH